MRYDIHDKLDLFLLLYEARKKNAHKLKDKGMLFSDDYEEFVMFQESVANELEERFLNKMNTQETRFEIENYLSHKLSEFLNNKPYIKFEIECGRIEGDESKIGIRVIPLNEYAAQLMDACL